MVVVVVVVVVVVLVVVVVVVGSSGGHSYRALMPVQLAPEGQFSFPLVA